MNVAGPACGRNRTQAKLLGINPCSRASRSSLSRKSVYASEIMALARAGTDSPFRLTVPNSVTTYVMSDRGVVTTLPGVRSSTMRLLRAPRRA